MSKLIDLGSVAEETKQSYLYHEYEDGNRNPKLPCPADLSHPFVGGTNLIDKAESIKQGCLLDD